MVQLSKQGLELVEHYKQMAEDGYTRKDGIEVTNAFSDFELRKFRNIVLPVINQFEIDTVLDYGGGGSDWDAQDFEPSSGDSAKEFFSVTKVTKYEPARSLSFTEAADCVFCIDVLEHIFLADVPLLVRELFHLAKKLLVINVGCYQAAALLPNGENAHITVRKPDWWKGIVDSISLEFPHVQVLLICSETFDSGIVYDVCRAQSWMDSKEFTIGCCYSDFGNRRMEPDLVELTPDQIVKFVDQLTRERPQYGPKIVETVNNNR